MIWSSPVRKSGTVDLSPIPNEIYLEIFGYLRPTDPNEWIDAEARQHFCNLALVCRFFSSVMLPWIFENLTFVEKDSYSQISSPHSSTVSAKFCRNVLDGDPTALLLAKHVKRWAFSGSPTQSKLTPAFLSMYFETFQHLPNLLELSLTNIVIPRNFFKRLVNVPTLEALKLGYSSFDAEMRERHLKHFKSLPLKRLALVHSITDSHLIRLIRHLNMTSLIRLELDLPFLKDFPLSNCSLPLEYLYLGSVEGSMPIAGFLEAMPYLKVLRVPWSLHSSPNSVLKPQVIPQLSELGGDWSFCASILPGRPISRVELFSMPLGVGRDQWKVLAGSTKPLIDLKVSLFCHINVPFWEHFPDLESLEIRPLGLDETWGETVNSIFKKWSPHPKLRSLSLVFIGISSPKIDSEETQVLELLNVTIPFATIVEISFPSPLAESNVPTIEPRSSLCHTWSYTRVVSGSWHRTFRVTRRRPSG